eukprot:scaffold1431_cov346-Pavlova_lutheri.AAC.31
MGGSKPHPIEGKDLPSVPLQTEGPPSGFDLPDDRTSSPFPPGRRPFRGPLSKGRDPPGTWWKAWARATKERHGGGVQAAGAPLLGGAIAPTRAGGRDEGQESRLRRTAGPIGRGFAGRSAHHPHRGLRMDLGGGLRVSRERRSWSFRTGGTGGARMVRQTLPARRRGLRQSALGRRGRTSQARRRKATAGAALSTSRHLGMHVSDEGPPRRRRCLDGVREGKARGPCRGQRARKDVHPPARRHRTRGSLLPTRHGARQHLGRAAKGMPAPAVELRRQTAQDQGQESKRIPGEETEEEEERQQRPHPSQPDAEGSSRSAREQSQRPTGTGGMNSTPQRTICMDWHARDGRGTQEAGKSANAPPKEGVPRKIQQRAEGLPSQGEKS